MKRQLVPLMSWVLLVLVLPATPAAAQGQDDTLRQIRDRAEIEDLMWRYARALDTGDADGYAAVYTPDGQFGGGANATKGRDALRKMVADLKANRDAAAAKGQPRPPMYHVIANQRLQFIDRDRARIEAYWMTVFGTAGKDTQPRVAAVGRSIDELVRVDGKWLIRSRNVQPQD